MSERDRAAETTRELCERRGIDYDEPDDFRFWSAFDRKANVVDSFLYHQPNDGQIARIATVRRGAVAFAELIMRNTPDSADQTVALRKVHEAMMDANKSIVNEKR